MLYLLIILCFCVLLYVLNIMSEILILRAGIEFLKDDKSKNIIKEIINEKNRKGGNR